MSLPVLDLPPKLTLNGPHNDIKQQQQHGYPTSIPSWARPKSPALSSSSASSSRPVSPARRQPDDVTEPASPQETVVALSAGCQEDHVYKRLMPSITYRVRRAIVRCVEWESPILAKYQVNDIAETACR